MALNKKNMLKWADALESDKWKQHRGGWGAQDGAQELAGVGLCCLNVASVLFTGRHHVYNSLPFYSLDANTHLGLSQEQVDYFIEMNDVLCKTFPEIAAHIRKMVEEV